MSKTTRVFVLLGDNSLRLRVQQQWRGNGITLVGVHAEGGQPQVQEIARLQPDVVVIDAEVDSAQEIVEATTKNQGIPVVTLVRAEQSGLMALEPLEWGATSLVPKDDVSIDDLVAKLEDSIHECKEAQVVELLEGTFPLTGAFPDAVDFDLRCALRAVEAKKKLVLLGAGIGGPMSVCRILSALTENTVSPIIYSQRFPEILLPILIRWLENKSGLTVVRATDGQELEVDHVYVTSGRKECVRVHSQGARTVLKIQPSLEGQTEYFDTLLKSASEVYGARAVGVLLSGSGSDGCQGASSLREAGGFTIVQDRASSIVYESSGSARDIGGAIECLPINEIAERIQLLMRPVHVRHS